MYLEGKLAPALYISIKSCEFSLVALSFPARWEEGEIHMLIHVLALQDYSLNLFLESLYAFVVVS